MNRTDATRLVKALREVREDRGASPNEARVAQEKAAKLVARFGLEGRTPPPRPRRPTRPPQHPAPAGGFTLHDILRMPGSVFAATFVPDWEFNAATGEHSDNVRVVRYKDRANWRIEVDP